MTTQYGIDVSNHQPNFDFAQAKREGFVFATHKVTQGSTYRDPFWPRAREEMLKHFPGRCGGYVFCKTAVSPQQEADVLAAHFGSPSDMWLQIDYEDTDRVPQGAMDLKARVEEYQRRGFKLLPVYLPRWYWQRMGSPDLSFLKDIGIWNSHYSTREGYASTIYETMDSAQGWATMGGAPVRILQFSDKALVARIRIDANAVRSEADLAAIFGGTTTTPEVPNVSAPLDPRQQHIVLDGAAQLASPHVDGDGTIGPRPLRNPNRYNVAGNDPNTKQAWTRACIMDLWNELVFDGYPVQAVADEFDPEGASLVGIACATYVLTKRNNEILEALATKAGI